MQSEYKEGDIVKLKSGGPPMTVESFTNYVSYMRYRCLWFVDGNLYSGDFREEVLQKKNSQFIDKFGKL